MTYPLSRKNADAELICVFTVYAPAALIEDWEKQGRDLGLIQKTFTATASFSCLNPTTRESLDSGQSPELRPPAVHSDHLSGVVDYINVAPQMYVACERHSGSDYVCHQYVTGKNHLVKYKQNWLISK